MSNRKADDPPEMPFCTNTRSNGVCAYVGPCLECAFARARNSVAIDAAKRRAIVVANDPMTNERSYLAFKALHAVYHERDFRVRVNDPTQNMVKRVLGELVGYDTLPAAAKRESDKKASCPACAAGFDFSDAQPTDKDRR